MTILKKIIDWVENKPVFWQVAIDRLIRNNELTDSDIHEITEICKKDFELSDIEFEEVDFEDLRKFAENSVIQGDIVLSKIHNIENINALSQSSELKFLPNGLTLVYGDNGAGKSSYVSVLKHTCNTRGHKPIINGNLYNPTTFNNSKKAEVEYTVDQKNFSSVKLKDSVVSDTILKSVDVFDAFSANHYVEGEDEIAFIPRGLSILEKFAIYLKTIEIELNNDLKSPTLAKFDYSVLEVVEGTSAQIFLENLNQNTTLDELRANSKWDGKKALRIEEISNEINKVRASDPQKSLEQNRAKIERFEIVESKIQNLESALLGEVLEELKTTLNQYVTTSQVLEDASERAFAKLPVKGVGSNSWKILWESARNYFNEYNDVSKFPETVKDSTCPLCLQDLGEDAKRRFNDFEKFVKKDIQKSYDLAFNSYSLVMEKLEGLDFSFKEQEPILNELNDLIVDFKMIHETYIESLIRQKSYLIDIFKSKSLVDSIDFIEVPGNSKELITQLVSQLKTENLKIESKSIDEVIKPLIAELNELNGVKKIFDFKPKLAREIFRQKKISSLNQCISKCNTRSSTTLSNELTNTYITQTLKDNFKTELDKLGFKNIKIETETKGERGKQYHFLRLDEENSNSIALKDILSEGEHRCISLATFLSELSISEHKSAIIFDDPVSSLDHKWRYKISKRIVEESKDRQVIVFTHDITFLLMIQEHSEALAVEYEITSLTRKKMETGIIAENPPWDALKVKKRIGLLKNAQQQLEKQERIETEEIYNKQAKKLYGQLRETWERFIEEVYLNGAIQRFGRSIQTKRLSKVIDLTFDDYKLIDSNMSKCSTYFTGHDTAGTLIEEMPDSKDFLLDIKVLEDFIKAIQDRRK